MTELSGITVGVVAYRRPSSLRRSLGGLVGAGFDLVVANVGPDDGVAAVVRESVGVRMISIENHGYAAAVNAIAHEARGDVVVFLNDDARMDASAVLRLAAVVAGGDADVAVPRVVDRDGHLELTVAAVPSVAALAREWLLLPDQPMADLSSRIRVEKWRTPACPERVEAASAVAVAARRVLLLDVPLPESYFLYWEESEWFWRLRERDAVVQYRPDVTCIHDGGRADVRTDKSRLLARNAVRCVRRTQGRTSALAAIGIVITWNARLVVTDLARWLVRPTTLRWARVRARGAGLHSALTSWGELR